MADDLEVAERMWDQYAHDREGLIDAIVSALRAARQSENEECAKVADEKASAYEPHPSWMQPETGADVACRVVLSGVAAAIRARIPAPPARSASEETG